jgi:hypothetical protein
MGDLERDIQELQEKTARTRYDFLKAEIQTCFTAAEMGEFELSEGNIEIVEREVAFVEKGIHTIERFLPGVSRKLQSGLADSLIKLRAKLDSLRSALKRQADGDSPTYSG